MIVTNSLSGGGAERSMNLVCNELTNRGWPVSLVPINSSPEDQVIPECAVFPLQRLWHGGPIDTLIAIWKFNQVVRAWKPDVLVLNCDLPELFGATVCGSRKLVVVEHSAIPWFQRKALGKIVRKILIFRKTTWVSVSNHLSIWSTNQIPTAVIQNPIINEVPTKTRIVGNEIRRLLYIGRLSVEKRPELAMKIAQLTHHQLIIIGDGSLRPYLEEQVAQGSLKVTFKGRLENPWAEIQSGDLLIVPSMSEGDGLVIVEAMQAQVPLLIADIPDLRRFEFPDRNYAQNAEDFANRIIHYSEDLSDLLIPSEKATAIIAPRSLATVGEGWAIFLNTF